MPAEIRLAPEAEQELREAYLWYFDRNHVVADAFKAEVTHAMSVVAESPKRWPLILRSVRHYVFPRFPFSLIYREKGHVVEVIAIAHQKRKPRYWSAR